MDKPHKQLHAWNISMQLVSEIYQLTQGFPDNERFGLTQQLRRASISIASNIAEGAARTGMNEFRHFISIARGSVSEVDTQMDIAEILGYLTAPQRETVDQTLKRVDKLL
ncbi:four helix bundle protein [Thiohalophilus sp.]|uniref:four helix bundle protein n=1 Tax=Thiohalophilus sp. TaxID=3028392 RepID=UPI002ACD7340|nr:four helix bundle protein [Thiohalophilus sp.]MDZ7804679.1 four helix bundle protein [Thiohalophilus sp.]